MDETAYLTDCSTFSHNSISTFDGKHEFIPRQILLILKKKDKNLCSRGKKLSESYGCTFKLVTKDEFHESDDLLDGSLVVLDDFDGPLFEYFKKKLESCYNSIQVRGTPAFIDACDINYLETRKRPLFCNSMSSMVFFISGFLRRKKLKAEVAKLIRYMGGSVIQSTGNRTTHVIADSSLSEGYTYGITFLHQVLSANLVFDCWRKRSQIGFHANELNLDDYRVEIFCGLFISFIGFDQNEDIHLQRLQENGGTHVDPKDVRCTHIVVNDSERNPKYDFESIPDHIYAVQSVWFWTSIKEEQKKPENEFLFHNKPMSPVACQRKSYSLNCCNPSAPLLISSPNAFVENGSLNNNESCSQNLFNNVSLDKKTHHLLELVQTEENYVNVLSTIMRIQENTVDPKQAGGALLSEGEAKIIFGNVAAIYRVHSLILRDLVNCAENWNASETLIGPIYTNRTEELLDCYSPFIRYFDVANNILSDCEKKNSRFHAYLQICKNKECGRQNMKDLLIRPVQRLASTSLLLKELINTTNPVHPDYLKLKEALKNIEEVMSTINNYRRDIADRSAIFDVFNLIENCPPVLISADRSFIFQFEAQEVTEAFNSLSRRGDFLVFYIFTDCLEVCRKKKKVVATTKEGNIISDKLMKLMHGKPYKHVILMYFSTIRCIDNIVTKRVGEDGRDDIAGDFFGLTCRNPEDLQEKHYLFRFIKYVNASIDKLTILTALKKIMEQSKTRSITVEPKIVTKTADEVGLNLSNLNPGMNTLTSLAYKTRVFVESMIKNSDNSSREPGTQFSVLPSSSFEKSVSLDNLMTGMQKKKGDASRLQTASFPMGKR